MREINYLSPSSIKLYYEDPKEFYIRYLCSDVPARPEQTAPMAAGSAFDAFVKSFLYKKLYGDNHNPKFDLDTLFQAQVDPHLRDQSYNVGAYLFEQYKKSGALNDLLLELTQSISQPRFELEVKGVISGYREGVTKNINGMVLLGKPDLFYINKHGCHVIFDWKVNGFYGSYNTVPMQGYIKLRNPHTIRHDSFHNNCVPLLYKGIMINAAKYLENLNYEWANQLAIYSWLLGVNVGEEFIVAIDQLCCNGKERNTININGYNNNYPDIRVAEHRLRIHPDTQFKILAKAQELWEIIHSEPFHFFRNMTLEESQLRCKLIEDTTKAMKEGTLSDQDIWLLNISRK